MLYLKVKIEKGQNISPDPCVCCDKNNFSDSKVKNLTIPKVQADCTALSAAF